ncbi:MAG: citramalate synthase [Anaerolineales bacterium]|nr:citramalate synthase [Anaerolineales bacterium]MCB0008817.1 citramalate synthase [Anaerolineales bacterium]
MTAVKIYDTTLRDGTQREGISLSLNDKLNIAQRLDGFGVHYIEGGWPGSNPKDAEFFTAVKDLNFKQAKIAAFGSTRRKNTPVAEDAQVKALEEAETPVVTIVGKSWDLHVFDVLGTDLEENLAMIGETIAYFKKMGKEVIYDAEHFFDGYRANPEYALMTLKVAAENGADCIVVCDTNGGSLPWDVEKIIAMLVEEIDAPIGVHTHDDGGCGVANTLAGVAGGAVQIQGTINGYGERVGNANLCTIIPDLQLKMGVECVAPEQLRRLRDLSHYVAEVANLTHDTHAPYVGHSAFAHKGGIHVAAMRRNPLSYQHIEPTLVGNEQRTTISELSGRGNVLDKAKEFGVNVDSDQARQVLQQIKDLEAQGFAFESAEASMSLMLQRLQPDYQAPFELLDFTVLVQQRLEGNIVADATVKVRVGDQILHTAAEGNGPVNALDIALRKALVDVYPQLADVRLSDYKVRILDSTSATGAGVRVLIDSENGERRWSTVGANTNIIKASWQALADSMEYALLIC